jgi:nucleoside 2-deoxyribosyltransferase
MKIYFAGSIRGVPEDHGVYQTLVEKLQVFGQVLTEHVGNPDLTEAGENALPDKEIFQRDMSWLKEADVIVAEVTAPSLGVGYEIGRAEALGKPVVCLYRQKDGRRLSAMIAGSPQLQVHVYEDIDQAVALVATFLGQEVR